MILRDRNKIILIFVYSQLEVLKREQSLPDIIEQKATESPRSPKSTKVDLINRMARMGQALPFKKTVPRTLSDSDETEVNFH